MCDCVTLRLLFHRHGRDDARTVDVPLELDALHIREPDDEVEAEHAVNRKSRGGDVEPEAARICEFFGFFRAEYVSFSRTIGGGSKESARRTDSHRGPAS